MFTLNKKSLFLGLILLLGASVNALSQRPEEQALFRGRMQNLYPYKYNGTFYLETRRFQKGSVLYNGKEYRDVLMNLDAFSMDLVAKPEENSGATILYRDQVSWFTFGNRRFVNLRYLGFKEAEEGYYEIMQDSGKPILKYTVKKFRTETNAHETPEMDGNFSEDIVNVFVPDHTFYQLENGHLNKLSRSAYRKKMASEPAPGPSPIGERLAQWHPDSDEASGTLPQRLAQIRGAGLPDGYFEDIKADTSSQDVSQEAALATFRNKIYIIGEGGKAHGNRATIKGTVRDAETGEPLPGAVIWDNKTQTYARSSSRGRYSLSLPLGENELNFNAESKEEIVLKIVMEADGTLDISMPEKVTLLKGSIVSAESMQKHRTTAIGMESVSMSTIGKIPSAFGEGDVIKAVLTLPGVKSVGEASGGFNVRGGSADQNLILFNDNTIYNPSHLFGIFSAFNPDLVEGVDLYKSSIPAEYGGRISSVLSVKTKDGDRNKIKGSLGIGPLTSRGHIEGPIGKKTTFIAGTRISYSDWILKRLPKNSAYSGGGASFTDANIGLTHNIDDDNSLKLSAYFATDKFSFSGDTTFHYTNANASLAYIHRFQEGKSLRISTGYDHYGNVLGAHSWDQGSYDLTTIIRQAFLKGGITHPISNHTLSYGADAVFYALEPGILNPFGEGSSVTPARLNQENGLEAAAYVSDTWAINDRFSVDGGIRFSSFLAMHPSKFYGGPEWRLSGKYSPASNLTFKAGVNTMRQYIHLISNTSSVSPMDTWRLSSAHITPTTGWQGAGGAYWTLLGSGIDLSVEGYYKESSRGLDYKSGALLSMNPNLADELVPVRGKAYGVEFMVRKPAGSLTGWVSYTYSRSLLQEMTDRGYDTINGGDWYNAPYDKPHEFKLSGIYAFTHRYSLSLNIDYSTGRPVTIPVGKYMYDGMWRLSYSDRNSYRIPDYFRMDAAINIDPGHYLKALAHASFTIGVYNITGRKNPYSIYFRTDSRGEVKGYMLSVFATQVPYVNINILF